MKFDFVVGLPVTERVFPVVSVEGVPCIKVSTIDTARLPSETIKVFHPTGGDTIVHNVSDEPDSTYQEVHIGDIIGVCAQQSANSSTTLNAYCVTKIYGGKAFTNHIIL